MRRFSAAICRLLSLLPSTGAAQGSPGTPHVPSEAVLAERNAMVRMRDGVRLATDIWRPARGGVPVDGKFPVLLLRTPYDKATRAP